jgi:CTP synthase (UTP-ammonia lyase)
MSNSVKIAIVGDFNFTYNTHHATNLALDHAERFLEIEISYYWIKLEEATHFKTTNWTNYDGIWLAPGPYKNEFYLNGIIATLKQLRIPVFITGEGFKTLVDHLILTHNFNPNREKLISDNLVTENSFEQIEIIPHSKALLKLYENHNRIEFCVSRYSIYPQLSSILVNDCIDVEAYNHFEEVESFSLKNHPFFLVTGFVPQVTSTREIPHPLVYTFIKACCI